MWQASWRKQPSLHRIWGLALHCCFWRQLRPYLGEKENFQDTLPHSDSILFHSVLPYHPVLIPRFIKLLEPFVQGSLHSKTTISATKSPVSRLIYLTLNLCAFPWGKMEENREVGTFLGFSYWLIPWQEVIKSLAHSFLAVVLID